MSTFNDKVTVTLFRPDFPDEVVSWPLGRCTDFVRYIQKPVFLAKDSDGVLGLYLGSVSPLVPWISYPLEIFEKIGKVDGLVVGYDFKKIISVERCCIELLPLGRYCGYEAVYGSNVCRMHKKNISSFDD